MKLLIFFLLLQLFQNDLNLKMGVAADYGDDDNAVGGPRIYGGYEVSDIRDFPFTAVLIEGLNFATTFFCACVKLTRFAAVTTANCISARVSRSFDDGTLMIRGNTLKWQDSGFDDHYVTNIYAHPNFSRKTMDYDVAVLKVNEPFERVTWIRLPPNASPYNKKGLSVTTLGWGSQQMDGLDPMVTKLYAVDLKMQDWKTCSSQFKGKLTRRMFCAGLKYHGPCTHDKGGPIFYPRFENQTRASRVLLGLVSFTVDDLCGVSAFTSIYTNLYEMRNWIMRRANKKSSDDDDDDDNNGNDY